MISSRNNSKIRYVSVALAGIALGLSFPKASLWILAWFSITPLLIHASTVGNRDAFKLGWAFGTAYFVVSLYWVDNSIRIYGHLPLFLSAPAVLLLALVMGLYVAIFAWLYAHSTHDSNYPAVIVAPSLWVSMDIARTYLLTGFPWASVGYSQQPFLHLIQIADLTGVYGVTFLVVMANGALADLVLIGKRRSRNPLFPALPTVAGSTLFLLLFSASLYYGQHRLNQPPSPGKDFRVTVVQGNIDQGLKWDPTSQDMILNKYFDLTRNAVNADTDLVIWPESSMPFVFDNDTGRTDRVRAFVRSLGKPLLLGAVELVNNTSGTIELANSALLLGPDGSTSGIYRKIHLVPFGEYVPLGLPLSKLVAVIGNFSRGNDYTVFKTASGVDFGTVICYEIIFPELVRSFAHGGSRFIATITNDAWFGTTSGPHQHFAMAAFRAIENRMPVVRAANTGISGVIDDRGRTIRATGLFLDQTFTETIQTSSGKPSFYTRYGNVFGYICMVTSIMVVLFKGENKRWKT